MRMVLVLCAIFLLHNNTSYVYGQEKIVQQVLKPENQIKVFKTPNSEVADAIKFVSQLPVEDREYIRFFTTYAIPEADRNNYILALSFIIHSMVGIPANSENLNSNSFYPLAVRVTDNEKKSKFVAYKNVPNSDTLWWIDLREYNWTPEAWEIVSNIDGYFAEPIVQHNYSGALRLLAGNAIVRADWFVYHSMSTLAQADLNDKIIYETLLYATSTIPKNLEEWYQRWGIDIKKSRNLGNEYGTVVTKSKVVSRHNRMLFGYRTELGYLYETYDVGVQVGKRDYVEYFFQNKRPGEPPDVSDAGEMFTTNTLGLQIYALRDDKNQLINFGDPKVVRHMTDVLGDARVRVAHSCIDCHAAGPIPSENTLNEFIESGIGLKTKEKADALRIKRSILSNRFEQSIVDNQIIYARAVANCNGLKPEENSTNYLKCITQYSQPVTLTQAAHECGVSVEELKQAVLTSKYRFGGRLKLLVENKESMPRDVWEDRGHDGIPGGFQQAMIMLHGLTVVKEENVVQLYKIKVKSCVVKSANDTVAILAEGTYVKPMGKTANNWYFVELSNGLKGYIQGSDFSVENVGEEKYKVLMSK